VFVVISASARLLAAVLRRLSVCWVDFHEIWGLAVDKRLKKIKKSCLNSASDLENITDILSYSPVVS